MDSLAICLLLAFVWLDIVDIARRYGMVEVRQILPVTYIYP